jgi:glutamyl-tRNA synthetase
MKVLPLVRERIKRFDDLVPAIEYFFSGDLDYTPVLADMVIPEVAPADVGKALLAFVERFEAREGFDAKILEEEGRAWAEALGWKTKHAFMLLRVATTGRKASPPLFDTMAVLGKEITRRRLRRAAEVVAKR